MECHTGGDKEMSLEVIQTITNGVILIVLIIVIGRVLTVGLELMRVLWLK
jgi:hypothetical protein